MLTARRVANVRPVVSTEPATPRSDAQLLDAHVAGDRYAFAELFDRHRDRLARLARRTCTPEDAADALQDAMLAAHRCAPTFRHQCAVSSWLHRIVVNACVDRLRHNKVHRTTPLEESAHPAVDHGDRLDATLMVHAAMAQLPADQRAALYAVELHGYSIADTAALLGIPQGTVKSRAARGRRRLASLLGPPHS